MNRRVFAFYLVLSAMTMLLVACVTRAAAEAHGVAAVTGGDGDVLPDVGAGVQRWWLDGRLASVVAFTLFVLLKFGSRYVPYLRRGRVQATISVAVASVAVVLPAAAQGTLTWGGLVLALCSGGYLMAPGGGEAKPGEQEPPS